MEDVENISCQLGIEHENEGLQREWKQGFKDTIQLQNRIKILELEKQKKIKDIEKKLNSHKKNVELKILKHQRHQDVPMRSYSGPADARPGTDEPDCLLQQVPNGEEAEG